MNVASDIKPGERIIILPPDHSRWWLLYPSSLIYYDKIVIDDHDFKRTINASGSSYHDLIAENANWITSNSDVIIPKSLDVRSVLRNDKAKKEASDFATHILTDVASKETPALITYDEIRSALINAYQIFLINLEEKQNKFLTFNEPYEKHIRFEERPESLRHLKQLKSLNPHNLDNFLNKNSDVNKVFSYLVGFANNMLDLSLSGHHIYEPLISEYLPFIEILMKLKMRDFIVSYDKTINFPLLIEVYGNEIKRIKKKAIPPLTLNEFFKKRESYRSLRKRLLRLDILLEMIKKSSSEKELKEQAKEIKLLIDDIRQKMHRYDFSEYGITVLSSHANFLLSFAGQLLTPPFLKKELRSLLEEFFLYAKGISTSSIYLIDTLDYSLSMKMRKSRKTKIYPHKVFDFWI